jgi:hypothetical protein
MDSKKDKNTTSDTLSNLEYYLIYIVVGVVILLIGALLLKLTFVKAVKEPQTVFAFIIFAFGILICSFLFYYITKYFIPFLNY